MKSFVTALIIVLAASTSVIAEEATDDAWQLRLGLGSLYKPAFRGSKDYQLSILPAIRLSYSDLFFASVREGFGFNVINSHGWKLAPSLRFAFPRREQGGSSPFRVLGKDTDALDGLGDVPGTLEPGLLVQYRWKGWRASVQARHGVNGHRGFVSDWRTSYGTNLGALIYGPGPPLIASLGIRTSLVSEAYNRTYFGISQEQSLKSGLERYSAKGGFLSFGVGSTIIFPLTGRITTTTFLAYDRLTGSAAQSPLVRERGSRDQFSLGFFLTYTFGGKPRGRPKTKAPDSSPEKQ